MATSTRYPLSTADGQAIPLDVIKPLAVLRLPFVTGSFNSQVLTSGYLDKLIMFSSLEDCYIDFNASPVLPASNVIMLNKIFVPAGIPITCIINSLNLNVIGNSKNGTLFVQLIDTWAGLALEVQVSRR